MKLKVEKFVYGGYGIGYIDGKSFLVPYVLPGEEVEVEVLKEKKSYSECQLRQVIEPSIYRQKPPCVYYQICGGCDIQHTPYDNQLRLKVEMFEEQLRRVGKVQTHIEEILISQEPFGYRNRVQFKFDGVNFGFYRRDSNQTVDIDRCMLLKEDINQIIKPIKRFLIKYGLCPSSVNIFSNEKDEKIVRFIFKEPSELLNLIPKIEIIQEEVSSLIKGVSFEAEGQRVDFGQGFLFYKVGEYTFRVSSESFFQVNRFQVSKLIEEVLSEVRVGGLERVLDFYCGVGTFSIPAGFYAKQVLGIESNDSAVMDAKANIRHNKVENVKFLKAKAEKGIKYAFEFKPDCVILDPPRAGVGRELIRGLSKIDKLRKVVYVSCNPSTLARDITYLKEGGFSLRKVKLIDMFPQTHHIESISVFERK